VHIRTQFPFEPLDYIRKIETFMVIIERSGVTVIYVAIEYISVDI